METIVKKIRSQVLISLVEKTKGAYIYITNKKRKRWSIQLTDLEQYPKNTLGKDLAIFLTKENFDLIAGLESHDIYHVLLNYSTEVEEEAQMQFFLLGNGKKSVYAIGTSFVAFLTMPDQWLAFWRAYRRGDQARKIHLWDFRFLLKEKTVQLRALMNETQVAQIIPLNY